MSDFKTLLAVGDIMSKDITSLSENESIQVVAARMAAKNISSLLLTNDENSLVGIVTEQDIVRRAVAAGLDVTTNPISMIMTKEMVQIPHDESIFEARNLMTGKSLAHLVVTRDGKPAGIVTAANILGT